MIRGFPYLSPQEVARCLAEVERLAQATATPPLQVFRQATGLHFALDQEHVQNYVRARIVCGSGSGSGSAPADSMYSWKEVQYAGMGQFLDLEGGRSGNMAYEANGNTNVPCDTVVKLYPVGDQEWEFEYCCGDASGRPGWPPMGPGVIGSGGGIETVTLAGSFCNTGDCAVVPRKWQFTVSGFNSGGFCNSIQGDPNACLALNGTWTLTYQFTSPGIHEWLGPEIAGSYPCTFGQPLRWILQCRTGIFDANTMNFTVGWSLNAGPGWVHWLKRPSEISSCLSPITLGNSTGFGSQPGPGPQGNGNCDETGLPQTITITPV